MPNFLFTAEYADGTIYHQHESDLPQHGESGNSFSDVIQSRVAPLDQLVKFSLVDSESPHRVYSVDLTDGTFEANSAKFAVEGDGYEGELTDIRLIYWIVTTRHFDPGDLTQLTVELRWQLGWQGNDSEGTNHQRILTFA